MSASSGSPSISAYGGTGVAILGISLTETIIATMMVSLRAYAVWWKHIPRGGWSVYWALGAWFVALLSQIFLVVSCAYGIGNHTQILVRAGTLVLALKWAWVAQIASLFAIGFGKVAVVSFLLAIQGRSFPKSRVFLITLASVNLMIDVACALEIAFHCSPPSALWEPDAGVCHNPDHNLALGYLTGSWNAASDLTLAIYPVVLLWKLQMPRQAKLGLCLLLGAGAFAAVCSAIKTWQVHAITIAVDPASSINGLLIWTFTEMWIVLILTGIAPLWPLIRRASAVLGLADILGRGRAAKAGAGMEWREEPYDGAAVRAGHGEAKEAVRHVCDDFDEESGIFVRREIPVLKETASSIEQFSGSRSNLSFDPGHSSLSQ